MKIPKDNIEFLYWFKQKTETQWSKISKSSNSSWLKNGKWVGLKDEEIKEVEKHYKISFTQEHKEFLKVLHSVDKKKPVEYYNEKNEIYVKHESYFYNWLTDEEEIKNRINWPYREVLNDVKRSFWLDKWGKRPNSESKLEKIFISEYEKAPKLIPIYAHRFVVNQPNNVENPILSVWGTDTIIYGWNMKHYLLQELGGSIEGLYQSVYDEEDQMWYGEETEEFKTFNLEARRKNEHKIIPFWSDLIEANL